MNWKTDNHEPAFAGNDATQVPFYGLVAPQMHFGDVVATAIWKAYESASRAAGAAWRWYAARQTERELMALDSATLKDIGISRGQIPAVSRMSAADPYFTFRDLPR
jgi:uncharacterized protein YjiS (DUF1127 family)